MADPLASLTYPLYCVHQVLPGERWQAVCWNDALQVHVLRPLYGLALGTVHTDPAPLPLGSNWCVFGVEYTMATGFTLIDTDPAFCGLLPPGNLPEAWEAEGHCAHANPPQIIPSVEGQP